MKAETKIMNILIRIAVSPFILGVNTVFLIILWMRWNYNFFRHGGEVVAYDKSMNRRSIADLFDKVQELDDSINNMEDDKVKSFVSTLHEMSDVGLLEDYLKENEDLIKEIKKLI